MSSGGTRVFRVGQSSAGRAASWSFSGSLTAPGSKLAAVGDRGQLVNKKTRLKTEEVRAAG